MVAANASLILPCRRYHITDDIPIMLIEEAETVDAAEAERITAKIDADGISPTFPETSGQ